jgi:hypothetical protein
MRAALPLRDLAERRVGRCGNSLHPDLKSIKLSDDFSSNPVVSLPYVHLSKTELLQLDCFIGQYIKTRNLRSVSGIDSRLRLALKHYPGKPPVRVNELNAWIDKTLGFRAAHPDDLPLDDH